MDGIDLGEEIRRLYPDLPVVLTSGYSSVLAEEGRHGFRLIHKPYSVEALSEVLSSEIKTHPSGAYDPTPSQSQAIAAGGPTAA